MDRLFASGEMDLFGFITYAKEGLALNGVEIEDKHFAERGDAYLKKVREACAKAGLDIVNLAFFNSFGFPTREENLNEVRRAGEWMDAAVALGCRTFRIFAGWMGGPDLEIGFKGSILPKTPEAWSTMAECVGLACAEAKKRGLAVVIENHNHGGFLSVSDDVLKLFSQVKADNLSLLLDTGNFADGIAGIVRTLHLVKRHVHLKCRDIRDDGSDNAFDLEKILSTVKGGGYNEVISIEYEGTQNERMVLPKLVKFVKDRVK